LWAYRLYDEVDMRLSYVVWQEGVTFVVELLTGYGERRFRENELEKSCHLSLRNLWAMGKFNLRQRINRRENGRFMSRFYAFLTMWFLVVIPIDYEFLNWWGRITKSYRRSECGFLS